MTKWNPDKIHYLTQSELKQLLSAIVLTCCHGVHASEGEMLHISDIDFEC
jgi:hypothetical protein